jgi:hypothetical protein
MELEVSVSHHLNNKIPKIVGAMARVESFTSSHDRLTIRFELERVSLLFNAIFCEHLVLQPGWISAGILIEEKDGLINIADGKQLVICREVQFWRDYGFGNIELEYSKKVP